MMCTALTAKGLQCMREAAWVYWGMGYCEQHCRMIERAEG